MSEVVGVRVVVPVVAVPVVAVRAAVGAQVVLVRLPAAGWMRWMTIFRSERGICR